MRSIVRSAARAVNGYETVPKRFTKLEPGFVQITHRTGAGIDRLPAIAYRSAIPCPEGVNYYYHNKWATLYDMLTDTIAPFYHKANDTQYPALDRRSPAALTAQVVDHNFGAQWQDCLALWHAEVFCQLYPEAAAASKAHLARQYLRLELTRYSTAEMAEACADGVPEDVDAAALEVSVAASVAAYKSLGEEKFKNKLAYEASIHGWSPACAMKYLETVKANV